MSGDQPRLTTPPLRFECVLVPCECVWVGWVVDGWMDGWRAEWMYMVRWVDGRFPSGGGV